MDSNSNYFPSWWIIRYHVYYCFEASVHCRRSTSYPEGVACKEVLVAGETGGDGLIAILYARIGALYGLIVKGTRLYIIQ